MIEKQKNDNYDIAKAEADMVDEEVIAALQLRQSFRVEAGAGSGKTYSLNKAIEWLQANRQKEYCKNKQKVICITYTNAAVEVIAERLSNNSFVMPSTIHSFAWNAISQYQSTLIKFIESDESFQNDEGEFEKISEVKYTLGHRYKENGTQYLYHNDVLKLFTLLLDNSKFRRIFADKYPLILIDEYQDSYKPIIDRFISYYIAEKKGPQFGFFGDAWQTIYQSNSACGLIVHENLKVIKKGSNFRSAPRIVKLLNDIRPDLPQQSAINNFDGEVSVVTCEDFSGVRRTDRGFRGDLPAEELRDRLNKIVSHIKEVVPNEESLKILMITHKVLAVQQGYENLLDILDDGLRDKEDPVLLFFMNVVEPIYRALCTSDMQLLFNSLGIKRYPITQKTEKTKWRMLNQDLEQARNKNAIDVIKTIVDSKLIPLPPQVKSFYQQYIIAPDIIYANNVTLKEFFELEYKQFLSAIEFLYPEAEFSTEHGVKGEEYDNVVFVISKGWNQYQFEMYAPMITKKVPIPAGRESAFERNRNLFYVCCSRAKKRLILFVTPQIDSVFESFLIDLVGKENMYTFEQYLKEQG
ncbi:MAG: AAA family ATPase [Roseburia sp.]|nr:AAA family ATPase [Roseburia sp.]